MESLWLQICDIQGRLFKLAWKAGYDSEDFMKQFMRSRVARDLDSEYNRMQWAGEEYLLEEFADEIYAQAPAKTMDTNYLMFHTMAPELAIEDLKELHQQKKHSKHKKIREN